MSLGAPHLLWLLAIVPVLVIAYTIDGQRRRRVLERIGHLPMIRQMMLTLSPGRRRVQIACVVIASAVLALSMARPQVQGRARLTESRGLDLVVALDLSRSMLAKDIYPSRLERAKAEVSRLLDELKGDRVGLVAFAGETLAYPLTTDYEAAKLFWRDLLPSDMPVGGTDLGRAITASQDLLDRAATRGGRHKPGQVIVLITDGEDTEGRGLAAAKKAAEHGIRVYAIAIGSKERPFVPLTDEDGKSKGYLSGDDGEPVRVGLDEAGLRAIASATGGDYFTIEPRHFGVERVQQAILGLERTEEEARLEREPEDVGRWFVLAGFLVLVLGASLRDRMPVKKVAVVARAMPATPLVVLILCFPLLGGFDVLQRKDPDIEAGNQALAAGKAEDALKAYDRAVAARPDDETAHYDRAAALMQLNKLPEATKELQRAVETRDPALKADAYYNLGLAQHKQEHFKEAIDAYKRALGLRPDDKRTKWNLEVAQRKLREQKEQEKQKQAQNDQKDQKDQKQDQKPDQPKPDEPKPEQKQDQKPEQKQADQKPEQKQADQKPEQAQPKPDEKKDEKPQAAQAEEKRGDTDKQDAAAVLDALERSEPTVQKDLARHRAGNRRPKRDW